jgi:hypothetical protein
VVHKVLEFFNVKGVGQRNTVKGGQRNTPLAVIRSLKMDHMIVLEEPLLFLLKETFLVDSGLLT